MEIIPILAQNKIHNKLSYAQGKRKTIRWVPLGGECWSILGWLLGMIIPPWQVWMSKNEQVQWCPYVYTEHWPAAFKTNSAPLWTQPPQWNQMIGQLMRQSVVRWEQCDVVLTSSPNIEKMTNRLVWDGKSDTVLTLSYDEQTGVRWNEVIMFSLLAQLTLRRWRTDWCTMGTEWYCSHS